MGLNRLLEEQWKSTPKQHGLLWLAILRTKLSVSTLHFVYWKCVIYLNFLLLNYVWHNSCNLIVIYIYYFRGYTVKMCCLAILKINWCPSLTQIVRSVWKRTGQLLHCFMWPLTINSCFCGRAPIPITNLFKFRDTNHNLRGTNMLSLPKVSSTKYGLRSFRYFAAKPWNALPDSIRAMAGKREFLRSIRYVTF